MPKKSGGCGRYFVASIVHVSLPVLRIVAHPGINANRRARRAGTHELHSLSGDALARILSDNPLCAGTGIVFHSSNDEDFLRLMARRYGVRGYICKGNPHDLRRKVAAFVAGAAPITPSVTAHKKYIIGTSR